MKGSRVNMFKIGQRVTFTTDVGSDVFKDGPPDKNGKTSKVFSHHVPIIRTDPGRIVKLHVAGKQGVAEIRPDAGVQLPVTANRKLGRRLQFVSALV